MSAASEAMLAAISGRSAWMRTALRELVEIESPSEEPERVNQAARMIAGLAARCGGHPVWHRQEGFGDVLELRFGEAPGGPKPVLLLGHLDTVWPAGTLRTMPWREEGGRFWGPGVLDMKAGVVMALAAIEAMRSAELPFAATLLLNSEEEIGSPVSRTITERLALESEAVFVLEPAQGLAYKTARKGVGHYTLRVTGVAAHAGVDFDKGHSAIREMARLVEVVSAFTDQARGRTVNCGVLRGGSRSNVVAAEAVAEVDVRVKTMQDASDIDARFHALRCVDSGCRLEVTGGINRPPMERRAGTIALFERARELAEEAGFVLDEAATGGGSDGNFTAALGVPTLDGMGAVGEGAHAVHESVEVEHLLPRTALLASMILSVSGWTQSGQVDPR